MNTDIKYNLLQLIGTKNWQLLHFESLTPLRPKIYRGGRVINIDSNYDIKSIDIKFNIHKRVVPIINLRAKPKSIQYKMITLSLYHMKTNDFSILDILKSVTVNEITFITNLNISLTPDIENFKKIILLNQVFYINYNKNSTRYRYVITSKSFNIYPLNTISNDNEDEYESPFIRTFIGNIYEYNYNPIIGESNEY